MRAAQSRRYGRRNIECPCHIPQAVSWGKSRLCLRISLTRHQIGPDGYAPTRCQRARDELALIEPTFAQSRPGERYRNECCPFLDHVERPGESRHALGHPIRRGAPPFVLEGMHDPTAAPTGGPTDGPHRANVRRQQITPPAAVSNVRMAAPDALRKRKRIETSPTMAAHDAALVRRRGMFTYDAHAWKQQIGNSTGRRADRLERDHRAIA